MAATFRTNTVKLHGVPKSIISDRDKIFTSNFWQHLFKMKGTTLAMSLAYHPQSNGQSEVVNKILEMYLRCFTFQNPKGWYKALAWAKFWYNTSFNGSLGMTPFMVVYGHYAPTLNRYVIDSKDPPEVQKQLYDTDLLLTHLRDNLNRSQQQMKRYPDKKKRDV